MKLYENEQTYYVFKIPYRGLEGLSDLLFEEAKNFLADLPDSMADLSRVGDTIVIKFNKSTENALILSVYGEPNNMSLLLDAQNRYGRLDSHQIQRWIGLKGDTRVIKNESMSGFWNITLAIEKNQLDDYIKTRSYNIQTIYNESEVNVNVFDLIELVFSKKDGLDKRVKEFNIKLNNLILHRALVKYLKSLISFEKTPNLKEVKSSTEEKLQTIKNLDFNDPDKKSENINRVLIFQNELLVLFNKRSIEKTAVTSAIIENFRILLKHLGSPKEIKDALVNAK
jgi:hypothetical protein